MKVLGAELQAFYVAWPLGGDWYHEDGDLGIDEQGRLVLELAKRYNIDRALGCVEWQGSGGPPLYVDINGIRVLTDSVAFLPEVFEAWSRDQVIVAVNLPAAQFDKLAKFAQECGWELIR